MSASESLENRVAIVVGGSGGFGEAIARRFVADGAKVVIAARDQERLEQVAQSIGAVAIRCDVTNSDDVKALAEPALAHRLILKTAASIRGVDGRGIISEMLMSVPIQAPQPSLEGQGVRI